MNPGGMRTLDTPILCCLLRHPLSATTLARGGPTVTYLRCIRLRSRQANHERTMKYFRLFQRGWVRNRNLRKIVKRETGLSIFTIAFAKVQQNLLKTFQLWKSYGQEGRLNFQSLSRSHFLDCFVPTLPIILYLPPREKLKFIRPRLQGSDTKIAPVIPFGRNLRSGWELRRRINIRSTSSQTSRRRDCIANTIMADIVRITKLRIGNPQQLIRRMLPTEELLTVISSGFTMTVAPVSPAHSCLMM